MCMQELAVHIVAERPAFECPNCLAQEHQCFVCKLEGRSDNNEIVSCVVPPATRSVADIWVKGS